MQVIIVGLYLFLILLNVTNYLNGRRNRFVEFVSFVLLFFLICGSAGAFDQSQHDLSNYRVQYDYRDPMENESFNLYYLFFISMEIGHRLGWSFITWWMVMTAGSLLVIRKAIKTHNISPHGFLFFFMIYYVFNQYTGLKYYYGFTFLFWAFGYLLRGGNKNKIYYCLLTCVAGGFHVMYYIFLIFALIDLKVMNQKRRNKLLKALCGISIIISVILRVSGTANAVVGSLFSFMESDKIEGYMSLSTNMGFYIPVVIQLLCLFHVYTYKNLCDIKPRYRGNADIFSNVLFLTGIITVVFYPLFMIALTFMRLISSFSIIAISYTCVYREGIGFRDRKMILLTALLIVFAYYVRQFGMGSMWESSVLPFFNLRYF